MTIQVPAYPGEKFPGASPTSATSWIPRTRTVKIRCVAAEPGRRAQARDVREGRRQRRRPPQPDPVVSKAVLTDGDKTFVIVATEGNVFRIRRVDVGPEATAASACLGGLSPARRSSPKARSS